jgi:hypothetical protein
MKQWFAGCAGWLIAATFGLVWAWGAPLWAAPQPEVIPPGYTVETIEVPESIRLEVGGLDFAPDGDLYIATRFGEVWIYRAGAWLKFAEGLHSPLGLHVDDQSGAVFVTQKPELTKLVDRDGDDRAEEYRTVTDAWGFSGNYHEYAYGPVVDDRGNMYINLNLAHGGKGVRGSIMGRTAAYRGWCVKVTPEGHLVPFASGLRSPAGLALSPAGELWATENQGDFVGTSCLYHLKAGQFYGHAASLRDVPGFADKTLNDIPLDELDNMRTRPAVMFPHGEMAKSPGNLVFDTPERDFGPFDGQMLVTDMTEAKVMRCDVEKVQGQYQGVVFDFIDHLQSGALRVVWGPEGRSLWVGQTRRGWNSVARVPEGLQRVVHDGKTTPYAIETIRLTRDGFKLRFTKPVDAKQAAKAGRYKVKHWGYKYHGGYGSPRVDETKVQVTAASVSADGRTVHLTLPRLEARQVYRIEAPVPSAAGQTLTTDVGYYTLNRKRK